MVHLTSALLLGLTITGKRRVSEIGFLLAGLGAVLVIFQGLMLRSNPSARESRGTVTAAAGVLLGAGFLLQLISLHF
jgi:hypothetical protein